MLRKYQSPLLFTQWQLHQIENTNRKLRALNRDAFRELQRIGYPGVPKGNHFGRAEMGSPFSHFLRGAALTRGEAWGRVPDNSQTQIVVDKEDK